MGATEDEIRQLVNRRLLEAKGWPVRPAILSLLAVDDNEGKAERDP